MAVTITRTPWIDDDGTGTTGTILNNAVKTELYGQIDGALAKLSESGAYVTAPGFLTARGEQPCTVNVPTRLFTLPGGKQAVVEVWACLPGSGITAWGCCARVLSDGYAAVIFPNNTAYMTLALGANGMDVTLTMAQTGTCWWGYTLLGS